METQNCLKPLSIQIPEKRKGKFNIVWTEESRQTVPCGKCVLCLHARRMQWLFRCDWESKTTELPNHLFLTLTYNEKKVPRKRGVRTLFKRHPQLFLKRLRKAGYKIKYILVGEYGGKTSRPHYHLICWTNAPTNEIDIAWGYGHIHYRPMERETILYTLEYILNPRQGDNEKKQREYGVFSKGIGINYLNEASYNFHKDNQEFTAYLDGKRVPLPRYYINRIFMKFERQTRVQNLYYEQLKKKMQLVRHFKAMKYEHPFKAYKELKHIKARELKFNTKFRQL